jgi:hypothetical protein
MLIKMYRKRYFLENNFKNELENVVEPFLKEINQSLKTEK